MNPFDVLQERNTQIEAELVREARFGTSFTFATKLSATIHRSAEHSAEALPEALRQAMFYANVDVASAILRNNLATPAWDTDAYECLSRWAHLETECTGVCHWSYQDLYDGAAMMDVAMTYGFPLETALGESLLASDACAYEYGHDWCECANDEETCSHASALAWFSQRETRFETPHETLMRTAGRQNIEIALTTIAKYVSAYCTIDGVMVSAMPSQTDVCAALLAFFARKFVTRGARMRSLLRTCHGLFSKASHPRASNESVHVCDCRCRARAQPDVRTLRNVNPNKLQQ